MTTQVRTKFNICVSGKLIDRYTFSDTFVRRVEKNDDNVKNTDPEVADTDDCKVKVIYFGLKW